MEHSELLYAIRVVRTAEEARALCEELRGQPLTSVDSEWYNYDSDRTNVNNGLAFSYQFAYWREDGTIECIYMHNYGTSEGNVHELRDFFTDEKCLKTAHNAPVDAHITYNHGIRAKGLCLDTMVADHLLDERRENMHGLKECAPDFLGHERPSYNETFGTRKKKKDGTDAATGWDVPSLPEFIEGTEPPTVEEALQTMHDFPDDSDEYRVAWKWLRLFEYAVADAYDGLLLLRYYEGELKKLPWLGEKTMWDYFLEKECPITDIITRLEERGMYLDLPFMRLMAEHAVEDLEKLEADVLEWAGCPMNLGSGAQLAKLLYGHGMQEQEDKEPLENPTGRNKFRKKKFLIPGHGYPILRTTEKGAPSTKAEHLEELHRYLINTKQATEEELVGLDKYLLWKKREKQRNTYLIGLQEMSINNRVHGRLNQIGTTSSRFSSSTPNLQNQPTGDKDVYNIRDCFVAPPGYLLVVVDYSQLEYRLLAHLTQDPKLTQMFINGWDLHSLTAYNSFPEVQHAVEEKFGALTSEALKWVADEFPHQRKQSKPVNFGVIYGIGGKKLADQLRIPEAEGQRRIDAWFAGYSHVKPWMNRLVADGRQNGFIRLLDGRYRRPVAARINSSDRGIRGEEERTLINSAVQGAASCMVKQAMIRVDRSEEFHATGAHMIMQVHDELIFEVPRQNAELLVSIIRPLMEQPFSKPLRVPMPVSVGIGPSWASSKD